MVNDIGIEEGIVGLTAEEVDARKMELAQVAYPREYFEARPIPWKILFSGLPRDISDQIHRWRDPSDFEPTTSQVDMILGYREGKVVKNALLDTIHLLSATFLIPDGELPSYEHLFTDKDLHWLALVHQTGSLAWDIETLRLQEERDRLLQELREHYRTCSVGTSCHVCHGNDPDAVPLDFQFPEQLL